jgi:hypothetical protein
VGHIKPPMVEEEEEHVATAASASYETKAHKPPMQESDEANKNQLEMAKAQGDAYAKAVEEMTRREAHGTEKRVGHYLVGYAVERAEGMYMPQDGALVWREPSGDENLHLEIVVRDAADGRFIPGLMVYATLYTGDGSELGTHHQPFLWHPWLYHYGRNWHVPSDGKYHLRVRVEMPTFGRHDKKNGNRFTHPVEIEFKNIQIQTGQKK